jgi:hypothetical protein
MTTATATQSLTTSRYPGWNFKKIDDKNYLATKSNCVYAVSIQYFEKHGWCGELLTFQRRPGASNYAWDIPRKGREFEGTPKECIEEAEHRDAYIKSK